MNYTTLQLAKITNSQLIGNENLHVQSIAYDSRIIFSTIDTAFIALNSFKNSGEKYINDVIEKGVCIIISAHQIFDHPNITWIITENTTHFLQKLAKYHFENCHLKSIGITGSNGKTIVKEWLYQCLWDEFPTVKSPKSFNSQIGLPLSLLQIEKKHQLGIFEVGISKPGEMKILEEIFSPEIGILTHIGTAHSINFESEKEIIDEKLKLFKESRVIIFNGDNDLLYSTLTQLYSDRILISYGKNPRNSYHLLSDWSTSANDIKVKHNEEEFSFPVKVRTEAIVLNALCVIAVLKYFNFNLDKIVSKLNAIKSVEMRLESVEGTRNNLIINDSFNLDIDSLQIAYQFIKEYQKDRKVLILTDIIDVKEEPEVLYPFVAKLTNEQNFDKIFLVGNKITKYSELFSNEVLCFETTEELIDNQELNKIENAIILLKGARKFEIDRLKLTLELQKHDTVLEVNLNNMLHNINVHKALLKPETKVMAMVKADSYGLGGYEIAEFLQHHRIDYLGVAFVDEGIDLRKKGITVPIMVMNPEQQSYNSIIDFNLEPEIYSLRVLKQFTDKLQEKGVETRYPVHIKLETGMHRLGFKSWELDELILLLSQKNLVVKSIFSHLSSADDEDQKEYTLNQIKVFTQNSDKIISALKYPVLRHILNSSGIANYTDFQFDMVRIGIGMVGISPNKTIEKQLKSAVSLKTVISQISEIKEGESVGYNRKFIANSSTKVATIPVGYADGIPRLIGNGVGKFGVHKVLKPIIGNICMDMIMLDLGDLVANEGDEVIIFNENPSLKEFSSYCNTIPYEVLTSISRRVKRVYIKD
ncbi:alanine racemase [Halpernia humi]|uniref:Alanine racemase n=1 Tax=Halpernia humi TaxID=493375 RepID=A0A1H5Y4D7_9FLAO|nr:bifunctional UDP-N-acetylmuramoyl-tripeptide:D-alanyl-D-alanine ligase/alanine racemase [Halpernia humi]SEG18692.1 alanine racemase [Halpernia humi]